MCICCPLSLQGLNKQLTYKIKLCLLCLSFLLGIWQKLIMGLLVISTKKIWWRVFLLPYLSFFYFFHLSVEFKYPCHHWSPWRMSSFLYGCLPFAWQTSLRRQYSGKNNGNGSMPSTSSFLPVSALLLLLLCFHSCIWGWLNGCCCCCRSCLFLLFMLSRDEPSSSAPFFFLHFFLFFFLLSAVSLPTHNWFYSSNHVCHGQEIHLFCWGGGRFKNSQPMVCLKNI